MISGEDDGQQERKISRGQMSMAEFRRLYDTCFPILYRVAYRIAASEEAAEDLCQEAFFRLHEKNMVFPSPEEAKYWLIRVVKNASLNYAKRKERERKAYQRAFREDSRQVETGEGDLLKKETLAEVQEALEKLPENLRIVLILKEYGELNYKEIGRALGISEGNVKVRVFRARERLSGLLAEEKEPKSDSAKSNSAEADPGKDGKDVS
ncbi:MAG: RNA polymerase sigma factor [Treponema sp.]|jgi:RNA polymerase sigma-70 factor (ECF subfamily)|nr:RNA polymerase sigma factor [Treponema sp.]